MADDLPDKTNKSNDIDAFLSKVAAAPRDAPSSSARGKLMFAMDATASRQPSWDRAAHIQAEMFQETANLGGLDIQLAFFRGFGEFQVSKWTDNAPALQRLMTSVICLAGETQIKKVLQHAVNEAKADRLNALVFVGDCLEEDIDTVGRVAGELGLLGVPAFMFHEGGDSMGRYAFEQIAKLTGGACVSFDGQSAETLKKLIGAVAVYAAGGRRALLEKAKKDGGEVLKLTHQMDGKR